MARNKEHGKPKDEMDFDFDEYDFDNIDGIGEPEGDDRSPKAKLKRFTSALKEEAMSPQARRQYLHDALPQNYHTTLNAAESISDAASDLYNDTVMSEWNKSRGHLKRVIRLDGDKLRRWKLGKIVDWAEQKDDEYRSDYNPEEAEVQRQMGNFAGDVKSAMQGGSLSPRERREYLAGQEAESNLEEGERTAEQAYQSTTVKQQSATVKLLSRILEGQQRQLDYQDQIDFNYKKRQIEFSIRGLIGQRKGLEQTALMRAEMKDGLAAITKNTGLPDYVKITSQENAKRLLRDKMVNAASDWAGSRISGTMRSFMNQTKRNLTTMGMSFREKAEMYADNKEMMNDFNLGFDEIAMSMGAGLLRSQASKRLGKHARKFISKNPKYTKGLDLTEAILANAGTYTNMAMEGRSGYGKLDRALEAGGYSGLGQQQRYRLQGSNAHNQDQAAFMDRRLKSTFLDVYPAWFNKIWKSIEGIRTKVDPKTIDDHHFDFKFNRLRSKSDLQKEFDNETVDDSKVKNYNDGIDNWINKLDPKGTLTDDARSTVRRWLINNHSAGRESFPVALFKGEGLPKGTSSKVRYEFEEKIPLLAGFDPISVYSTMQEGVGLELHTLRKNPNYRRMSKALGNADAQARSRHPVDNRKLASMTERYGANFAVDSGLARYDREGNVSVDNENIVRMVNGGGNRNYKQRANLDWEGNAEPIEGVDQKPIPSDDNRRPIQRMGRGIDRKAYDTWANAALGNINGPRLRGFASGGFTSGDPDEVAGVTHGDEAVIDSTGTKNNKNLLRGIMKLGAPVIKNGKLNRTYYKFMGFTSPEQVDMINNLKDMDLDEIKSKVNETKDKAVRETKDRLGRIRDKFKTFREEQLHSDGYNQGMGPTPEFMGPMRKGGLRNNIQEANDLIRDPQALASRLNVKEKLSNARKYAKEFDHRDVKESAEDYSRRAREAVRRANQSETVDFDKTKSAIDKAISEGKIDGTKQISLYMEGQTSPFITKGDFATGRFRNKTSGSIITRPADIMDDIVLVDDHGEFVTIATMVDMLEGVFDSRGNPIKLPGLQAGYRKYIKRTTQMAAAIKNTRVGQFVISLKQKLWDDQPVDVCIIVNGELVVTLKASGFLIAQYIDAETGEVLKSHNDIQGAVKNLQGETVLTIDELANGIFDIEGRRLKISKIKHYRNKLVTKIEGFAKKKFGEMKNKFLSKALDYVESKQSKDLYVMRWNKEEKKRVLTRAFSLEELHDGTLLDVRTSKTLTKLSEIVNPVYSKRTKSVVVTEDEIPLGFFDEEGKPFKDKKNMSVDERLDDQFSRAKNYFGGKAKNFMSQMKKGWSEGFKSLKEKGSEGLIRDPEDVTDVYVTGNSKPSLTVAEFLNGSYAIFQNNTFVTIYNHKPINGDVYLNDGEVMILYLTVEEMSKGLIDAEGNPLKTKIPKQTRGSKLMNNFIKPAGQRIKAMMGKLFTSKMKNLYLKEDMNTPALLATRLNGGFIVNLLSGKVVKSYADLNGGVRDIENEDTSISAENVTNLVFSDGSPVPLDKKAGLLSRVGRGIKGIGSKLNNMRKGSWQWLKAQRDEANRNKKQDININVGDKKEKKEGFLGKLLIGLGTMFGGMFTSMMLKFGGMFKKLRNAIMLSKVASAAGGAIGGSPGGRGKAGLAAKLIGGGLAAGGAYGAYKAFGDAGDDMMSDETPEEQKAIAAAEAGETDPSFLSSTWNAANTATGGFAGEIATTAALTVGGNKLMEMRRNRQRAAVRQGLASRVGRGVGNAAGAAGRGLGAGARDAGRAGRGLGRAAGGIGRGIGGRAGMLGRVAGGVASGVGKAARWALSPTAAMGRLSNVAKIGGAALKVGKFALGAARFLTGPIGIGLMAATWIGGKLWDRYKSAKNPLMRFRVAQYGFDFEDEATTSKLLDLENLMKDYVTVNGEGQPSIKDNVPEDQIFQLFEIDPQDPKGQEHVQRFIAWWVKRFKPVYLSYIKQVKTLINKTDLANIDEELSKKDKLTVLKGVNFTNSQNNPYLVSASPFKDPAETPLNIGDVEKAYEKCFKIINKMPDDKKEMKKATGEEVKSGEDKAKEESKSGFSWLDNTKDAIKTLADDTLKVTRVLAKKTDEVFGGWFTSASDNVKNLWEGASDWLTKATSSLADKIKAGWESIKSIGGSVAAGAGAVASSVGGAVSSGANAVYDGVVGTYEKISGKQADTQKMVYKGFLSAGLSDNQARILTAEVGRENDYQARYIFGGHVDANNGAQNLGMISWQKGRATKLATRLKQKGLLDASGNMIHSQAAIDEQAKFLVEEIKTDPIYKRTKDVFLSNPNVSYQVGAEVLGRNFIRWDYDGKKINASSHHKKRDKYFGQISQQVGKSGAPAASGTSANAQTPTGPVKANGQVKAGQKQVTTAEMKKLSTAAPKPATPLGPEAMKKWETSEAARKKQLDATRKGIVSGTHVVSDNKPTSQEGVSGPLGPVGGGIARGSVPEGHRAVKAATLASQKALPKSSGFCAKFVANALQGAGYKFTRQNSAYQYANGALASAGFTKIPNNSGYRIGDILVYPAHGQGTSGGGVHGHIQIYNGTNWISDFRQPNLSPGSKYSNVTPSLWRDSTLVSGAKTGAAGNQEAKDSVADTSAAKPTSVNANDPIQVRQAAARQQAQSQQGNQDVGQIGVPSRVNAPNASNYQQASKNTPDMAANLAMDNQARDLQLQETKVQTGLLREIKDAITGHRNDNQAMGNTSNTNLNQMGKIQTAQMELMAAGVSAMTSTLKEMRKDNSQGQSLQDQFPISANK